MTIRDLIKDGKFTDYEVYEQVGSHGHSSPFHGDLVKRIPDEEINLDAEVLLYEYMNEQDYDDTILANSEIRANYGEWYDDKNAIVLCILVKSTTHKWVFYEYRDGGGIGSTECFDTQEEAVEHAKAEWDRLCAADKQRYINDPAGMYLVSLVPVEWDEIAKDWCPDLGSLDPVWSALD